MYKVNVFDKISVVLVLIGAINWGTIGMLNRNLISLLVGGSIFLQRIIYILIFASALDLIFLFLKCKNIKILD